MASKKAGQTSPDNREPMATTSRIEMVSLDKLRPYENNARTHSPEQVDKLRASLREFGFVNPILVDRDYGIIAGHGRLMAAQAEGMAEVPCVFVEHLTETQKRAYILADNKLAELAGWDEGLLELEIGDLSALDFDIGIIGFGEGDFDGIERPEKEPTTEKTNPYDKHHVLITCDAAKSPEVMEIINRLQGIEGVEIDNAYT